jgi:hypothetical protein
VTATQRFDVLSRRLDRATFGVFTAIVVALLPLVTAVRMNVVKSETFGHAFYWTIAHATSFGAGPDPQNSLEYALSITWMILSVTLWSAIFADISARLVALARSE